MSGSGRKSQYRKSVTEKYLDSDITPKEGELIVLVLSNRGANIFEIQLPSGEVELARLPNKFNKLIWIKKNEYLIVERNAAEEESSSMKVKYAITNVINKDNIKSLKTSGLWPEEFNKEKETVIVDEYSKDDLMPGYVDEEEDYEDDMA